MASENLNHVANVIIDLHRELFEESPSPMKLQKLCYYAQGYALAEDKELFSEDFQAWQHGPVLYDLYSKYKSYQWRQITEEIKPANDSHREFLQDIVAAFGRYDGAALSTMTHRESPWLDARGDLDESEGSTAIISKTALKDFFSKK
ncbi:MAG: Panacea domain-containing protein [Paraglaciecola chathamensis]